MVRQRMGRDILRMTMARGLLSSVRLACMIPRGISTVPVTIRILRPPVGMERFAVAADGVTVLGIPTGLQVITTAMADGYPVSTFGSSIPLWAHLGVKVTRSLYSIRIPLTLPIIFRIGTPTRGSAGGSITNSGLHRRIDLPRLPLQRRHDHDQRRQRLASHQYSSTTIYDLCE